MPTGIRAGQAHQDLAILSKSEGSKVLDRVRIWRNENRDVHYELKRSDGVPYLRECIPLKEWSELRSGVIKSIPSLALPNDRVIDLLTVLSLAAELDYEPSKGD